MLPRLAALLALLATAAGALAPHAAASPVLAGLRAEFDARANTGAPGTWVDRSGNMPTLAPVSVLGYTGTPPLASFSHPSFGSLASYNFQGMDGAWDNGAAAAGTMTGFGGGFSFEVLLRKVGSDYQPADHWILRWSNGSQLPPLGKGFLLSTAGSTASDATKLDLSGSTDNGGAILADFRTHVQDAWEHYVFVFDDATDNLKIYLDGNTTPIVNTTFSGYGDILDAENWDYLSLGTALDQSSTKGYEGAIGLVRIYDTRLSAADVNANYLSLGEAPHAVPEPLGVAALGALAVLRRRAYFRCRCSAGTAPS